MGNQSGSVVVLHRCWKPFFCQTNVYHTAQCC